MLCLFLGTLIIAIAVVLPNFYLHILLSCYTDPWINNIPKADMGIINVAVFDESGGKFYAAEHGITVTVPCGAIPSGVVTEMTFGATLIAPIKFSDNAIPVSAVIWLCMDVTLQKPIQLQIPHCVNVKTEKVAQTLKFAKVSMHSNNQNPIMKVIEGGKFAVGKSHGTVEINHFCYYCIESINLSDIPDNLYLMVTMKEIQPNIPKNLWKIHVCIIPSLSTCLKVFSLNCTNFKRSIFPTYKI